MGEKEKGTKASVKIASPPIPCELNESNHEISLQIRTKMIGSLENLLKKKKPYREILSLFLLARRISDFFIFDVSLPIFIMLCYSFNSFFYIKIETKKEQEQKVHF